MKSEDSHVVVILIKIGVYMYKSIKNRLFSSRSKKPKNQLDMTMPFSNAEAHHRIKKAMQTSFELSKFIGSHLEGTKYISLGENCSSAWYLKQLGLKKESYPFDWVFSSPEIIVDCISNRFDRYLDEKFIFSKSGNTSAGHSYYHESFFSHRNPLASKFEYDYFKRCCDRFLGVIESKTKTCYLITLINEPSKRTGWANGFTGEYSRPESQDLETTLSLIKNIKERNENAKFLIIDHYTNSSQSTSFYKENNSIFFVEFHACGESTGVLYTEQLDDFCFKLIVAGLYGT